LLKLAQLPKSKLEEIEKLEQLRILENGFKIKVVETEHETVGIDTMQDLERLRLIWKEQAINGKYRKPKYYDKTGRDR
jgi:3-deoxy-manno-octulosonate cytidylyltransferase (CMP-KDO synthetase)